MKFKLKSLLTAWSSKLAKTGFFHVFVSTVVNKILGFLSNFLIVRLISKADYGVYSSATNILSFFLLFTGLGTLSSVLQLSSEHSTEPKKRNNIFRYGSGIGIVFNIILGFVILIFAQVVEFPIAGVNKLLFFLAFIPVLEIINEFQKIYFRSKLDNQSYAKANTINTLFIVLFSVVGSYFYGVYGLIIGRYLAVIGTIIITYFWLNAPIYIRKTKLIYESTKVFFQISFVSMLNNGLSQLLYLLDVFIVGLVMTDPLVVAEYKIAIIVPEALLFIPAAICTYVYPYFSNKKDDKKWLIKNNKLLLFALGIFNLVVTMGLLVFTKPILLIFGEKYLVAKSIFQVSAIGYFFTATFRIVSGNLLVTQRQLKFNLFISLLSGILNIIGNYILISKLGAIGAAWTTLIVNAFSGMILTYYFALIIHKKEGGI